jgi:membrane peptidoglycan carboxypeptidase
VSYALQGVVKKGTGKNALDLQRPAAGKTGTATNNDGNVSSSWFVGYTPQLSTAVMYARGDGNDNLNCKKPTGKICDPGYLVPYFGAEYPTRTWTEAVRLTLDDAPVEEFPPPANVKAKQDDHAALPTFTPSPTPTRTKSPEPTKTRKPSPTPTPTPTPSPSPTPTPTPTPTQPPSQTVIPSPTNTGGPGKPKNSPSQGQ